MASSKDVHAHLGTNEDQLEQTSSSPMSDSTKPRENSSSTCVKEVTGKSHANLTDDAKLDTDAEVVGDVESSRRGEDFQQLIPPADTSKKSRVDVTREAVALKRPSRGGDDCRSKGVCGTSRGDIAELGKYTEDDDDDSVFEEEVMLFVNQAIANAMRFSCMDGVRQGEIINRECYTADEIQTPSEGDAMVTSTQDHKNVKKNLKPLFKCTTSTNEIMTNETSFKEGQPQITANGYSFGDSSLATDKLSGRHSVRVYPKLYPELPVPLIDDSGQDTQTESSFDNDTTLHKATTAVCTTTDNLSESNLTLKSDTGMTDGMLVSKCQFEKEAIVNDIMPEDNNLSDNSGLQALNKEFTINSTDTAAVPSPSVDDTKSEIQIIETADFGTTLTKSKIDNLSDTLDVGGVGKANDTQNNLPLATPSGATDSIVTSTISQYSAKPVQPTTDSPEQTSEESGLALINDRLRIKITELQKQAKQICCELAFVGDRNWRLEAYLDILIHTLQEMGVTDVEDLDKTTLPLELFKVKVKAGYRLGPYNGLPQRARRSYERDGCTPPTIDLSGGSLAKKPTEVAGNPNLAFNISGTDDVGLSRRQMLQYESRIENLTMQNHFLQTQLQLQISSAPPMSPGDIFNDPDNPATAPPPFPVPYFPTGPDAPRNYGVPFETHACGLPVPVAPSHLPLMSSSCVIGIDGREKLATSLSEFPALPQMPPTEGTVSYGKGYKPIKYDVPPRFRARMGISRDGRQDVYGYNRYGNNEMYDSRNGRAYRSSTDLGAATNTGWARTERGPHQQRLQGLKKTSSHII